jgi:hypothetical protein
MAAVNTGGDARYQLAIGGHEVGCTTRRSVDA